MPTLRDDLIPLIDDIREEVVDGIAGLRLRTVATRTRTWSGTARGLGAPTDVDHTLSPVPKVMGEPRARSGEGGRVDDGELTASKVSLAYARADLDGGTMAATVEFFWLIDGEPYRVVSVEERFLAWEVRLRTMRGRP